MQTIFYNAKILTMNEKEPLSQAMLVNDDSIVFVGKNDEVLALKQDETQLVDMHEKTVLPAFFDNNVQIYQMIEQNLKNAKKLKNIEIFDENDENYENFVNFEVYKKEFLKIQKEFLKHGITTVQELGVTPAEFVFLKKLSEEKLLKIDVVAYVDIITAKKVMDDNCRTYRKYRNGFRLGGYYLALDGDVVEKKAWLKRPYKHQKGYCGYTEIFEEQLEFLIKTALEEKKQLMVSASGDRAVEMFINCFESVVEKEKVEDKFKPVIINAGLLSKKQIEKMSELDMVASFKLADAKFKKDILKNLGMLRFKNFQPIKLIKKSGQEYLIQTDSQEIQNLIELYHLTVISKNVSFDELLKVAFQSSSNKVFDGEQKGSLESGKLANFLVIDSKEENLSDLKIEEIYLKGEKI